MKLSSRVYFASRVAGLHLVVSFGVALFAALLVFGLWYPFPYRELAGGRELFLLIVSVDVVCGPLLTLVLFNPAKPRAELWRDLGMVAIVQCIAQGYGLTTVWQARPLYLVAEVDRFKVIAELDLREGALAELPDALQPNRWSGPKTVAIREPKDSKEREQVLFESLDGGRDFAERPDFYLPYEGAAALKTLVRAKPLSVFLAKYPDQQEAASKLAHEKGGDLSQWLYLPVRGRQDWVAVLDKQAQIQGFLKGDGF